MQKVTCVSDGREYCFNTDNSETAIKMMRHFLDIGYKDADAAMIIHEESYYLRHGDKVYVCNI